MALLVIKRGHEYSFQIGWLAKHAVSVIRWIQSVEHNAPFGVRQYFDESPKSTFQLNTPLQKVRLD